MAKITRQTFVQFAVNVNAAADICEFGTPATGSPVYTINVATLQALAAWTTGWAAETIASNRPFLEDMNAVCYVYAYMLAYLFEMGVPEYDAGTTYYINSVVQYSGTLYTSLTDANIGNTPVVGANWKLTIPLPFPSQNVVTGSRALTTIYQNTSGKTMYVSATVEGNTNANFHVYTDANPTPTTLVKEVQIYNNAANAAVDFMVLPNNYYYIDSPAGAALQIWVEWH